MCIPAELPRPQVFLVITTVIKCECAPAFEVALEFSCRLVGCCQKSFLCPDAKPAKG